MKVIVAGSRDITDYVWVLRAISEAKFKITEIVSGGAKGVDSLGEMYAKENGIPLKVFPADWKTYGKADYGPH
jgi:predicted Rossmann fold nucleotide-binding protein DprA/Smf involved in DNA uptake